MPDWAVVHRELRRPNITLSLLWEEYAAERALLIIDDWGPEPLTAEQRRDMLEIAEDRYEKGSLLMTSQIPVKRWHELIADPTIGDAILDRVVHRAHRIELTGLSLRKRHAVNAPAKGDGGVAAG